MLVLRLAWIPSSQTDPYALDRAAGLINDWIVIPAALGALFTGLLESWLTPWGFFRHRWVTVKWIATVTVIVASPLITAPWDRADGGDLSGRGAGLASESGRISSTSRW